jgi:hypothetical protein
MVLTANTGIPDATQIVSRFVASAIVCRCIAAYELAGMRAAQSRGQENHALSDLVAGGLVIERPRIVDPSGAPTSSHSW